LSTVLLLEAANVVHIDRVELSLGLLLVGRKLLVIHRLKTDGRVITNTDNKHTAALLSALVVVLIGEGDMDLRDVIGGGRRRIGVGKHGTAVLVDDEDARAAVMCCLDGEAVMVDEALAVAVVVRRQAVLLGLKDLLLLETGAAEKEEDGHENEAEENKTEKTKH
jgi:threonine synthase